MIRQHKKLNGAKVQVSDLFITNYADGLDVNNLEYEFKQPLLLLYYDNFNNVVGSGGLKTIQKLDRISGENQKVILFQKD